MTTDHKCPDCGAEIEDIRVTCPKCGYDYKKSDYADTNAAADPVAIADELVDRADGQAIFVVWMSEYMTLEGQCEALVNNLGAGEQVSAEDGAKFFEPANVHWFPAGRAGT